MNERERLIELLEQCSCAYPPPCTSECADCNKVEMYDKEIANIADHLLANGVTVQRWPKEYLGRWGICYPREKEDAPEPPMEEE